MASEDEYDGITGEELSACLATLERARDLDPSSDTYLRLENAAASLRKSAKRKRRATRRQRARADDKARRAATSLSASRLGPAASAPEGELQHQSRCYMCSRPYRMLHEHFHRLCLECGAECLARRQARTDLSGRRAVVTGGRIKIGYAIALKLLRDGAEVHVTTRFPQAARASYAQEADAADWESRLHVHGLDFRDLGSLDRWVRAFAAEEPTNILVNNAAQTIWRPPEYYKQLWERERRLGADDSALAGNLHATAEVAMPKPPRALGKGAAAPAQHLAVPRLQDPLDLRRVNSWVQTLGEISSEEFVESQVVNGMAPFLLCNGLRPSFLRSSFEDRYIINVAAREGQFALRDKLARHPHTNMAKAALNMLTCTSGSDYAAQGIFMVSVDPGWVSHEVPEYQRRRAQAAGFHTPLEMVDAAARLYHPIVEGRAGNPLFGRLLKNFREVPW